MHVIQHPAPETAGTLHSQAMADNSNTNGILEKTSAEIPLQDRDHPSKKDSEELSTGEILQDLPENRKEEEEEEEQEEGEEEEGDGDHDKEATLGKTLDTPKGEETKAEAEERIKLERRRRRCPDVKVSTYQGEGVEESKDTGTGKRRSLPRVVMEEDVEGFMRLTREGARVSEADAHGWTPLHWACSRGSAVMAHVILQELRTPEEAAGREGSAPDESTSDRLDNLDAAEELNGWTPLHLAAIGGHLDVVYLLMEAGCDGHVKDKVGDRPINCIKRATSGRGGLAARLRNALLDLSDAESSDDGRSAPQRGRQKKKQATAGHAQPGRKINIMRERHRRHREGHLRGDP